MKLIDLVERSLLPQPWGEADNIPWNDPAFSERMLAEHLTQDHDAASRRFEIIDQQVTWIHNDLLSHCPCKILDLGCGPGLYANRLSRLGHSVTGIDFSPASLRYARQQAEKAGLRCSYIESDLRSLEYGADYDFVMLIFGEFNVFKPADAGLILEKITRALKPGGMLLLEPQDFGAVQRAYQLAPIWRTSRQGLFSEKPHLYLQENFWDDRTRTVTSRYWVVDAETAAVDRYAQTTQAYTDGELEALLHAHGFSQVAFYPALAPKANQPRQDFFGVTAVRI
jgi:ubiquinone/menaquinone biosynthesis C-methylase UbiE